jgi:hypothetical protein
MPPGSAALVLMLALARQRLVGGVTRWQGAARADRSAGSHRLPRRAFAGKARVAEQARFAGRASLAGRAGVARPRGLAGCLRCLG